MIAFCAQTRHCVSLTLSLSFFWGFVKTIKGARCMVTTRSWILNYMSQSYIYWKWYVSNIISWNLLWTNHRDSSWFRTYFKLRTGPVHHTRVIRLTLCIGLHNLKSLKTLKFPKIYINLWNPHVLRIQVIAYSKWQLQHLYILITHILNTL